MYNLASAIISISDDYNWSGILRKTKKPSTTSQTAVPAVTLPAATVPAVATTTAHYAGLDEEVLYRIPEHEEDNPTAITLDELNQQEREYVFINSFLLV